MPIYERIYSARHKYSCGSTRLFQGNEFTIGRIVIRYKDLTGFGNLSGLNSKIKPPSQYFSNFFNAYARRINIAIQRTGALFERPFKRILSHAAYCIYPSEFAKHKFVSDFRDWNYSSYHELTSDPLPAFAKHT